MRGTRARSALSMLCILALGPTACASDREDERTADEEDVEIVGFAPAPEPLQRSLDYAIEDLDISGASIAVIDGNDRWVAVGGHVDPKATEDMHADTPFAIASITKTFTTTAALLLAEDGVVDLDERVEIASLTPATLRDLLGHTAGLGYAALHDDRPWTPAEMARRVERDRACAVGECWHYSDLGFVAAGLVLEHATGEPLRDLYERLVFRPLGLDHTELVDRDHVPPGVATSDKPGGWPPAPAVPVNTWAAGAIVTTATDLARFADALFSGELLNDASLDEMLDTARSHDLPCAPDCPTYGLGIQRYRVRGHPGWGHSGSSGAEFVRFDDGTTIAVVSTRPDTGHAIILRAAAEAIPDLAPRSDIYDIDKDGTTAARRLTDAPEPDTDATWSPDGTRVVFSSSRDQDHAQLYILDTRTGATERLTRGEAIDEHAAWSPLGDRIAFIRDATETREIYTVRPDGSDLLQVTNHDTHAIWGPAWSPDGSSLAYEIGERDGRSSDIAVVGADGTRGRVLPGGGSEWSPSWSPNGTQLAFWRGGVGIVIANADGSDDHPISGEHVNDRAPTWGPDGRIAFLQREDIWTMEPDGSDRRQITTTEAVEGRPRWSPDGTRLVFSSDAT